MHKKQKFLCFPSITHILCPTFMSAICAHQELRLAVEQISSSSILSPFKLYLYILPKHWELNIYWKWRVQWQAVESYGSFQVWVIDDDWLFWVSMFEFRAANLILPVFIGLLPVSYHPSRFNKAPMSPNFWVRGAMKTAQGLKHPLGCAGVGVSHSHSIFFITPFHFLLYKIHYHYTTVTTAQLILYVYTSLSQFTIV